MSKKMDQWDELIQSVLVGQATDDEFSQLHEAMEADRELRDRYRSAARLDGAIRELAEKDVNEHADQVAHDDQEVHKRHLPVWFGKSISVAVIVLLTTLCAGLLIERQQYQSDVLFERVSLNGVATLTRSVDVESAGHMPEVGSMVDRGPFQMKSGLVQLEMNSGVILLAEGEVSLSLVDGMHVECQRGTLRLRVPPHAKGFKLSTPSGSIVDLGTEFGVAVRQSGMQVEVFDGVVAIQDAGGLILRELSAGESYQSSEWGPAEVIIYPEPGKLMDADYQASLAQADRWRNTVAKLRDDPDLKVMYYPDSKQGWGRTVKNLARDASPTSDGVVIGAQWSEGRFPGSESLDFKREGNQIRFEEHGSHDAITMIMWLRIDGFDRRYNSLMLSDGWTTGDTHWHFAQEGYLIFGIRRNGPRGHIYYYSPPVLGQQHLGKWVQLAVTYDGKREYGAHYFNGELLSEHEVVLPHPAVIGSAALGNWTQSENNQLRTLNGRIDFFAYFSRAMSPEEIGDIYENGRSE